VGTHQQHLDAETLAAYVDGRLAVGELDSADRHIDACRSCRSELSALAAASSLPIAADREAPEGTLGRYHLLRELGRGAMGIVLRAWDPELARPVAIKLLRDVESGEQLRDEARTLARLRHPNVVAVYDVLGDEHGMYVAMELVDGTTLRGYCNGRTRREILDACARAGRGLAAAHDAGVVHRDFKPENVLVGDGGEVRVSDFGLARATDAATDGALAGTPAYMAPEVLRRERATARSDQYSYCVTVHEMLTGRRPIGSDDVDASLPSWIARVLRRGLAREPAERWDSLHVIVDALADNRDERRRRRLRFVATTVGALATGGLAVWLASGAAPTCDVEAALGEVYDGARRADIVGAIDRARGDGTRVARAVDLHAAAWIAARRDACEATHVRGEQTQLALDRRVACLDRGRRELDELLRVLAFADAELAGNAQDAIARLRDPTACTASDDALPADVAGRVRVEHARTLIDRAAALQYAGRLDDADALAERAARLATATPRLAAEALLVQARVAIDRAKYDRAEERLFDALHAAQRGRDDHLVAEIWVELVMTTGAQQHRFDLALSNVRAADAALARVDPGALELRYTHALGALLLAQGKLDQARPRIEQGLALTGTDPRRRGQRGLLLSNLCDVERQAGHLVVARKHCDEALALVEQVFGPDHVRVAITHNVTGSLAFGQRDWSRAERHYRRVLEIFERRNQADQLTYALAVSNLGAVYSSREDLVSARAHFERAAALFEAHHPVHPQRLFPLQGLASLALRDGDPARAADYYARARDMMVGTYAPESPQLLTVRYNLALAYHEGNQPARARVEIDELIARTLTPGKEQWMLAARGLDLAAQLADARKDFTSSLALLERALAASAHANVPSERALLLRHVGQVHRRTNKPTAAVAPLEEALALFEAEPEPDAYDIGTTRYHLAFALSKSGRDPVRAIGLARQAARDLANAKTGEALAEYRAKLAAFLRGR
jgi:eukaryotic-like serine/threonine-protein kinase